MHTLLIIAALGDGAITSARATLPGVDRVYTSAARAISVHRARVDAYNRWYDSLDPEARERENKRMMAWVDRIIDGSLDPAARAREDRRIADWLDGLVKEYERQQPPAKK